MRKWQCTDCGRIWSEAQLSDQLQQWGVFSIEQVGMHLTLREYCTAICECGELKFREVRQS